MKSFYHAKTFFGFLFLLAFAATESTAAPIVECEHPLLQRIEKTLPVFYKGLNYNFTEEMYRGVKDPQFDVYSILQYLFHDPYTYSAARLITEGKSDTLKINEGSWDRRKEMKQTDLNRLFQDRWDKALALTSEQNEYTTDNGRSVWTQRPYSTYNGSPYYHWLQFISRLRETAVGYGNFILRMNMPTVRYNADFRTGDQATIVPLIVAPWEVAEVDFNGSGTKLVKHFNEDSGQQNRCVVDYLSIVQNNKKIGYMSLCAEAKCEQDPSILAQVPAIANQVQRFELEEFHLEVSKEEPIPLTQNCARANPFNNLKEFQEYHSKLDLSARVNRIRRILRLLTAEKKHKCDADFRKTLGFWKQVPESSWQESLLLGLYLPDASATARGLADCLQSETGYDKFESKLESFIIFETEMSRPDFVKFVLQQVSNAPRTAQSAQVVARLSAYLSTLKQ